MDFSSQGKQVGVDGHACLAMLIWLAMRLKLEEDVIIFENVTRFPRHLLEQALGHKYIILWHEIGPNDLGWPVRRPRLIGILMHKSKVVMKSTAKPWGPSFGTLFAREPSVDWGVFFLWRATRSWKLNTLGQHRDQHHS